MPHLELDLEAARRRHQLAFAASGQDMTVGDESDAPMPATSLVALHRGHPDVHEVHDSGLTATVFKLHHKGRDWAVKRARRECRVRNVDGQTSFLNEVQRRAEFTALKAGSNGAARWQAVADTTYASLRHGVIVSPWIDGHPVQAWSERALLQLFDAGRELVRAGFFEWDFCPGNVLDDGRQVRLFDFGYMYRFDPLRHFNSAGTGTSVPQCHLAERIETRHVFGWLMQVERSQGMDAALAAFRLEKTVALSTYERLQRELAQDGASASVLDWLGGIMDGWRKALGGDLHGLYLREGWRSHRLDLEDDLQGQTCTPSTLQRADWLLGALRASHAALAAHQVFTGSDAALGRGELLAAYERKRDEALGLQVTLTS
ncbi:MAG: hypothetical protein KF891_17775 [Rhizobacter sp.]|nr:hypothetical protein [Rhizobacter sp.]